jgi:hypothetical protein
MHPGDFPCKLLEKGISTGGIYDNSTEKLNEDTKQ